MKETEILYFCDKCKKKVEEKNSCNFCQKVLCLECGGDFKKISFKYHHLYAKKKASFCKKHYERFKAEEEEAKKKHDEFVNLENTKKELLKDLLPCPNCGESYSLWDREPYTYDYGDRDYCVATCGCYFDRHFDVSSKSIDDLKNIINSLNIRSMK